MPCGKRVVVCQGSVQGEQSCLHSIKPFPWKLLDTPAYGLFVRIYIMQRLINKVCSMPQLPNQRKPRAATHAPAQKTFLPRSTKADLVLFPFGTTGPQVIVTSDKHSEAYRLDHVFDSSQGISSYSTLHPKCVQPVIDGLFQGYNGCVSAYGQTGAGKSWTMGTDLQRCLQVGGWITGILQLMSFNCKVPVLLPLKLTEDKSNSCLLPACRNNTT